MALLVPEALTLIEPSMTTLALALELIAPE